MMVRVMRCYERIEAEWERLKHCSGEIGRNARDDRG